MDKKPFGKLKVIYETVTGLVFVAVFLCALLQIISRYVLRMPIPWTEEMARYFLVLFTMLGAVTVTQKGGHLGAYFLRDRVKGRLKCLMFLVAAVIGIVFMAVILVGCFMMLPLTWQVTATTVGWFRTAYLYGGLILGSVLMLLFLFQDLAVSARMLSRGNADRLQKEVSRPMILEEGGEKKC